MVAEAGITPSISALIVSSQTARRQSACCTLQAKAAMCKLRASTHTWMKGAGTLW